MIFRGHFQNAYVTHDLGQAMDRVRERYGVSDHNITEPDMTVNTPSGERHMKLKVSTAWTGSLQIELIQPVSGFVDHYAPYLPKDACDPTPRFHHVCVRRDDREAMRKEIETLGLPVAFESPPMSDFYFIYLDARESLGHYFEYIWASPRGWEMLGWPEHRPVL